MSMTEAAKLGDVFCTVTGNKSVLTKDHFALMKDGAIISNSGHFNVEIDIPALENMSSSKRTTRTSVEEYSLKDGRKINLLGEGRLINLACGGRASGQRDGYELRRPGSLGRVHGEEREEAGEDGLQSPDDLDKRVAKLKLESMSIKIDQASRPSRKSIWRAGAKERRRSSRPRPSAKSMW